MDHFSLTGFSASNMLSCIADGGDIYQVDYMGNRRLIGKTLSTYQELESTTKEYYDKLVELGVITPQKTTEEMMADMQNTMLDMSKIIATLKDEVKELKANGSEQSNGGGGRNVPEREYKRGGSKGTGGNQRDGE